MVAPFSFLLIYLLRSDWIPFLFKLKSPRVITEQDFHLIKLQTTRESQTKVNAHLCSLKWEPQLRSGDSEQINPNLDQNLRFGGSGLSCFTQQAKGGFSAVEILDPSQPNPANALEILPFRGSSITQERNAFIIITFYLFLFNFKVMFCVWELSDIS